MSCQRICTILAVVMCAAVSVGAERDSWPLIKGAYWVYRAEVQSQQPPGRNGVLATQLTWRLQVVDTYRRHQVEAALMRGHPADLAFYTPGTQPRFWVLARSGNVYYMLRDPAAWERLHDKSDSLSSLIATPNEFFSFPMKQGDLFGQDPKRDDNFYGWLVEDVRPADLSAMSYSRTTPDPREYVLIERTMSGTESVTFVPGVGITRYVYHHNGTISDVDAVLIEAATHGQKASKD